MSLLKSSLHNFVMNPFICSISHDEAEMETQHWPFDSEPSPSTPVGFPHFNPYDSIILYIVLFIMLAVWQKYFCQRILFNMLNDYRYSNSCLGGLNPLAVMCAYKY